MLTNNGCLFNRLSKLPTEVIVKLEESKNLDENWTVKLLRESLK